MKRFLALLVGFSLSAFLFAQDVITTTKGESIEALVIEITETTVSYRKWDNANGPNYKMNIENIHRIRYENGTSETFSELKQQVVPASKVVAPEPKQEAVAPVPEPKQASAAPVKPQQPTVLLIGDNLYNLQGRKLENYEVQQYFGDMYNRWKKYTTQYTVGAVFCAIGTGVCVGSWLVGALSSDSDLGTMWGISAVGLVFDAIGIPLCIVGEKKRKDLYRERVNRDYQYNAELMFGGTKYGTGLSLRF